MSGKFNIEFLCWFVFMGFLCQWRVKCQELHRLSRCWVNEKGTLSFCTLLGFVLWLIYLHTVLNMSISSRLKNTILKCFHTYNIYSINHISLPADEFSQWNICFNVNVHRCYSNEFDTLRICHCAVLTNCWEPSRDTTTVHIIPDAFKPLPLKIVWLKG